MGWSTQRKSTQAWWKHAKSSQNDRFLPFFVSGLTGASELFWLVKLREGSWFANHTKQKARRFLREVEKESWEIWATRRETGGADDTTSCSCWVCKRMRACVTQYDKLCFSTTLTSVKHSGCLCAVKCSTASGKMCNHHWPLRWVLLHNYIRFKALLYVSTPHTFFKNTSRGLIMTLFVTCFHQNRNQP